MSSENKIFIHPTAIIDSNAQIAEQVGIGPYSIVEDNVQIGRGSKIDSHALLASGTRIGEECAISKGAVLGTPPQDLKFKGEPSELIVGDRTIIREFATLNRATAHGGLVTRVGSNCMLMAYTHVAHDCILGDYVILANAVNMAGHTTIEDHVSIGGMTVIHQFVKIGKYAYVGGRARVSQDIPPYILTTGEPMQYYGPNVIGLRRKGFNNEQIESIKHAYQYIFRSKLNLTQAVDAIKSELPLTPEINEILRFIEISERGLMGR